MKKNTNRRIYQENNRLNNPKSKLLDGSLTGKFPVVLNGGKTIIYISDKSKEEETRIKFELRIKELGRYHQ